MAGDKGSRVIIPHNAVAVLAEWFLHIIGRRILRRLKPRLTLQSEDLPVCDAQRSLLVLWEGAAGVDSSLHCLSLYPRIQLFCSLNYL